LQKQSKFSEEIKLMQWVIFSN